MRRKITIAAMFIASLLFFVAGIVQFVREGAFEVYFAAMGVVFLALALFYVRRDGKKVLHQA